jgi:hypothetical protein
VPFSVSPSPSPRVPTSAPPSRCSCERTQAASDAAGLGSREQCVVVLDCWCGCARLCVSVCKLAVHLREVCSCRCDGHGPLRFWKGAGK